MQQHTLKRRRTGSCPAPGGHRGRYRATVPWPPVTYLRTPWAAQAEAVRRRSDSPCRARHIGACLGMTTERPLPTLPTHRAMPWWTTKAVIGGAPASSASAPSSAVGLSRSCPFKADTASTERLSRDSSGELISASYLSPWYAGPSVQRPHIRPRGSRILTIVSTWSPCEASATIRASDRSGRTI